MPERTPATPAGPKPTPAAWITEQSAAPGAAHDTAVTSFCKASVSWGSSSKSGCPFLFRRPFYGRVLDRVDKNPAEFGLALRRSYNSSTYEYDPLFYNRQNLGRPSCRSICRRIRSSNDHMAGIMPAVSSLSSSPVDKLHRSGLIRAPETCSKPSAPPANSTPAANSNPEVHLLAVMPQKRHEEILKSVCPLAPVPWRRTKTS